MAFFLTIIIKCYKKTKEGLLDPTKAKASFRQCTLCRQCLGLVGPCA